MIGREGRGADTIDRLSTSPQVDVIEQVGDHRRGFTLAIDDERPRRKSRLLEVRDMRLDVALRVIELNRAIRSLLISATPALNR